MYEEEYSSNYLEFHRIVDGEILNAEAIHEEFIEDLLLSYKKVRKPRKIKVVTNNGWNINNILYFKNTQKRCTLAFYTKPMKRFINCTQKLIIPSGEYHFPGYVYLFHNDTLKIFQYKTIHKDIHLTKLYYPLLPNVDNNGSVCFGNVKNEQKWTAMDIVTQVLNNFWNSYFHEWLSNVNEDKIVKTKSFEFMSKETELFTLEEAIERCTA